MDSIVAKVRDNDYSALTLVEAIVLSVPFQMQAPAPPGPQSQSRIRAVFQVRRSRRNLDVLVKPYFRAGRYSEALVSAWGFPGWK